MKYEIKEVPFSILECTLQSGETMQCQRGAMAWMTRGISMETKAGGVGRFLKRTISGEDGFLNTYTASNDGTIAFAMSFPGKIIPINVSETPIAAQKSSFLACESTVHTDIYFQEKIGAGFFGGEGFIMQKFSGSGHAFIEIDGGVVKKELAPAEEIIIDSGYLAAMDMSCRMRIEKVGGIKNAVFGGEGLFNTVVTGPGRIWLQTMPISAFVDSIVPHMPFKKED